MLVNTLSLSETLNHANLQRNLIQFSPPSPPAFLAKTETWGTLILGPCCHFIQTPNTRVLVNTSTYRTA